MVDNIKIQIIELFPITTDCALCGEETIIKWGVPMYEGKIVTENHPDWCGMPVCKRCYDNVNNLKVKEEK
jgi:hypothetical protein